MAEEIGTISCQLSAVSRRTNAHWNNLKHSPLITIQTPVYNRRSTLKRAIDSVQAQTFRDIEYIIVDDGSDPEQAVDDIVDEFMNTTDLPVMFIKKPNGGVHTARNAAVREARGKFIIGLDSDDELTQDCCRVNIDAWENIPDNTKHLYYGVMSIVLDHSGNIEGEYFPENVNSMSWEDVLDFKLRLHCDHHTLMRADVRKANLMPEPEGVKFVGEGIFWDKVYKKYRAWCINEELYIAHLEGDDHLSRPKKDIQWCKNTLWMTIYMLNNQSVYSKGFMWYLKGILRYRMLSEIMGNHDQEFVKLYPLVGTKNRLWSMILSLPGKIALPLYRMKHKMKASV